VNQSRQAIQPVAEIGSLRWHALPAAEATWAAFTPQGVSQYDDHGQLVKPETHAPASIDPGVVCCQREKNCPRPMAGLLPVHPLTGVLTPVHSAKLEFPGVCVLKLPGVALTKSGSAPSRFLVPSRYSRPQNRGAVIQALPAAGYRENNTGFLFSLNGFCLYRDRITTNCGPRWWPQIGAAAKAVCPRRRFRTFSRELARSE